MQCTTALQNTKRNDKAHNNLPQHQTPQTTQSSTAPNNRTQAHQQSTAQTAQHGTMRQDAGYGRTRREAARGREERGASQQVANSTTQHGRHATRKSTGHQGTTQHQKKTKHTTTQNGTSQYRQSSNYALPSSVACSTHGSQCSPACPHLEGECRVLPTDTRTPCMLSICFVVELSHHLSLSIRWCKTLVVSCAPRSRPHPCARCGVTGLCRQPAAATTRLSLYVPLSPPEK